MLVLAPSNGNEGDVEVMSTGRILYLSLFTAGVVEKATLTDKQDGEKTMNELNY